MHNSNIQTIIEKLVQKQALTAVEMQTAMQAILNNELTSAQLAAFLIAMRMKGETVTELLTSIQVLKQLAIPVTLDTETAIDIVGTGGDLAHTFNISTCCSFVVAAAGGKVAKHGNRAVSSKSGSADVLAAAGIKLDLTPAQIKACIETIGIGFMFAPQHHIAIKNVAQARKELGIRTFFNLIAPLCNPANVKYQLVGVYAQNWLLPIAEVLQAMGSKHALVVCAEDGLDEISINSSTHIAELKQNKIIHYTISPEQFGIKTARLTDLTVKNAAESLLMLEQALQNQAGAARDIVALNAGAAIYVAGLTDDLSAGVNKALALISSGVAYEKFNQFRQYCQQFI